MGSSDTNATGRKMAASRVGAADSSQFPVSIDVFAPGEGDRAGVNGVSWFVDLDLEFPGNIRSTGITGPQLTGPGVHNNAPPFPGDADDGQDDRFGGLVVLVSTYDEGGCENVANLFNITGVTNVGPDGTEIWDTWIVTEAEFGRHTPSTLQVAEVADLNNDGIYNDAPDEVPDANGDGVCDATDVRALGLASDVTTVNFFIR